MSEDFDTAFVTEFDCCGAHPRWQWDEDELYFVAECDCLNRHLLRPLTAEVEQESDEVEGFNEED